ncbi:MAG TPA: N-acetylglucosamine-6-phosphate deacetylase [Flavitalea sp.]|nr:N-acetylglucosamine-6-phosphate deacetylase [Flavitalea sp.]
MKTAYTNSIVYSGESIERNKAVLVENGFIDAVVDADNIPADYRREDLGGLNIAPALIDLQLYGGNGKMFSHSLDTASLQSTYDYCMEGGAAHFMITMATNSIDNFLKGIEAVRAYWDKGYKGLLGLHMEGPYLNPIKKGAHIERYIKKAELDELKMLFDKGRGIIKMMTIAPELCSDEALAFLLKEGILLSAGHSNADYSQATRGFDKGIPMATHLFNAMSPLQGREPGLVGAVYDHPSAMASIICDGAHVDFVSVRISKKIMKERLFFITDAVTEVKEGEYRHYYKGDRYTLENGTLSGSAINMMKGVCNAVQHAGISLEEALKMSSTYPARLLGGEPRLGKIAAGYKADLMVFTDQLEVVKMIVS